MMEPTGSIMWVFDVGGVGFMGKGYTIHTNPGRRVVCMVYPTPHESHSPNIQLSNNTACDVALTNRDRHHHKGKLQSKILNTFIIFASM